MTEIWRPIKGYESRYEVSNLGNVRNVRYNNRPLSPFLNSNGYYLVSLSKKRTCYKGFGSQTGGKCFY